MTEISQEVKNEYICYKVEEMLEKEIDNICFLKLTNDKSNYILNIIPKNDKVNKSTFNKVKKLDTKYFSTLCDNWEVIQKLDCAYCFPYDNKNPDFGHSSGEVPVSVGIKAMLSVVCS